MTTEKADFIYDLEQYVRDFLARSGEPADYCHEALHVTDARNRIFRSAGKRRTDESEDIYALQDLCRLDEDTLEYRPDRGRIASVAGNYFRE